MSNFLSRILQFFAKKIIGDNFPEESFNLSRTDNEIETIINNIFNKFIRELEKLQNQKEVNFTKNFLFSCDLQSFKKDPDETPMHGAIYYFARWGTNSGDLTIKTLEKYLAKQDVSVENLAKQDVSVQKEKTIRDLREFLGNVEESVFEFKYSIPKKRLIKIKKFSALEMLMNFISEKIWKNFSYITQEKQDQKTVLVLSQKNNEEIFKKLALCFEVDPENLFVGFFREGSEKLFLNTTYNLVKCKFRLNRFSLQLDSKFENVLIKEYVKFLEENISKERNPIFNCSVSDVGKIFRRKTANEQEKFLTQQILKQDFRFYKQGENSMYEEGTNSMYKTGTKYISADIMYKTITDLIDSSGLNTKELFDKLILNEKFTDREIRQEIETKFESFLEY